MEVTRIFLRFNTIAYCTFSAIFLGLSFFNIPAIAGNFQSWPTRYFFFFLLAICILASAFLIGFVYVYKLTPQDISQRLGCTDNNNLKDSTLLTVGSKPLYVIDASDTASLIAADEFDCRIKWPGSISPVRQQGACGSCCVFAATSMLADRWAIHHSTAVTPLSVQYLIDCKFDKDVCQTGSGNGENLNMLTSTKGGGTVTELCYPYTHAWLIESDAAHHAISISCIVTFSLCVFSLLLKIGISWFIPDKIKTNNFMTIVAVCSCLAFVASLISLIVMPTVLNITTEDSVSCRSFCMDSKPIVPVEWFDDAYEVTQSSQTLDERIISIKTELVNRGPVLIGIGLPSDFPESFIWSGIYSPTVTTIQGGHGMTIIGWKSDAWIVRNQWGTNWGLVSDRGCYLHKMGTCNIEDWVLAGSIQ